MSSAPNYSFLDRAFRRVFSHEYYSREWYHSDAIAHVLNHEYELGEFKVTTAQTKLLLTRYMAYKHLINVPFDSNDTDIHIRQKNTKSTGTNTLIAYIPINETIGEPNEYDCGTYSLELKKCNISAEERQHFITALSDFVIASGAKKIKRERTSSGTTPARSVRQRATSATVEERKDEPQDAHEESEEQREERLRIERRDAISIQHFGSREEHKRVLEEVDAATKAVGGWKTVTVGGDNPELVGLIEQNDVATIAYNLVAIRTLIKASYYNNDDQTWSQIIDNILHGNQGSIGKIGSRATFDRRIKAFKDNGFKLPHPCMIVNEEGEAILEDKENWCLLDEHEDIRMAFDIHAKTNLRCSY